MYLRSLKPETEEYLNLLAIKLHSNSKGNLKKTIEDLVDYLDKGDGLHEFELYLNARSKIQSVTIQPNNLDFLYQ